MIENYSKNLCPVIEIEDLQRAYLYLPDRVKVNTETKSDTHIVLLDGDEDNKAIDIKGDGQLLLNAFDTIDVKANVSD